MIDRLLNRQSGLLGLAGTGDVRVLGDEAALAALAVWRHRIRHIGPYIAMPGGTDVLVFISPDGVSVGRMQCLTRAFLSVNRLDSVARWVGRLQLRRVANAAC